VPNECEPMGMSIWFRSSTVKCRAPGATSVVIVISVARSFLLYVRLSRTLIVHWFTRLPTPSTTVQKHISSCHQLFKLLLLISNIDSNI
jgi:hypothetical protein